MSQESGFRALGDRLLGLLPGSRRKSSRSKPAWVSQLAPLFQLKSETPSQLGLIAVLAALCGTGVLYILNAEAKEIESHGYSTLNAVMFVVLLVVYRVSQISLIRRASGAIEEALDRKRRRSVELVLSLSLRDLEHFDKQAIRDGVAAHYGALSQTLVPLISGVESLVLLFFMFVYLVTLSVLAAVITVAVMGVTIIGYVAHHRKMTAAMLAAANAENLFRRQTDGVVGGAKELQLNVSRREALQEAMKNSSTALADSRSKAAWFFADLIATGTSISYFLAGVIVFILPLLSPGDTEKLSEVVIAIIFILGPIGSLVQTMQHVTTAEFSMGAINRFQEEIETLKNQSSANGSEINVQNQEFQELRLDAVEYRHDEERGFKVSDINLTIRRGEVIFLTGGNGSGKTTLLRILTGLYPRAAGEIMVNGQRVPVATSQRYRDLFSSVFADFYLFDAPYGLAEEQLTELSSWLEVLRVRDKLGPNLEELGGEHLSTGQRKRVALALALTEHRPILVLDEWAADQDPETRRWFYETLLKRLKSEGFTVFVITHDEQYFGHCDRRFHMVEGQLTEGSNT